MEEEQKKAEEIKRQAEEAIKQAEEAQKKAQEEREPRVLIKKAQLEEANKELEAFFQAVSNDLSAPLDGIDECSKAFLENYAYSLDDKGKDYLIRIRAASQRMMQLFQDIDQLSQISLSELRRKPVDLSSLANKKVIELKEGSPDRKAEFLIQEGVTAQGDARLLGVLIEQLFNNSWTYTAQKTKTRIEFGVSKNEEKLEFFVKDNGKGFEMSMSDKIFIPFQTLHDDDVYPGTGMGLAIVRRIVHKHGGIIHVKSRPGKGTTVFFTLGDIE
jgi:light-regulated signal transduction histidine kinase (bacteriophytochrome)